MLSQIWEQNIDLFRCPVCAGVLKTGGGAVFCIQNHSFDISAKGYVNFLNLPVKHDYDAALFRARREAVMLGFFRPMTDAVAKAANTGTKIKLLDTCCGEGSHLAEIASVLGQTGCEVTGLGFDISKDGIKLAAKDKSCVFFVADLTKMPLADSCADVLTNILSPANYREFLRVLKPGGVCIKVVPNPGHLKELRTDEDRYENLDVVRHFYDVFDNVQEIDVKQVFDARPDLMRPLARMTPLMWNAGADELARAEALRKITLDLKVLTAYTNSNVSF